MPMSFNEQTPFQMTIPWYKSLPNAQETTKRKKKQRSIIIACLKYQLTSNVVKIDASFHLFITCDDLHTLQK